MNRDERLVRRAARGDRRAFAEIYERYHQELYRFCLAMVGNPMDAQEALQNAMVKVLRALPGEKREIKLKPWLYQIARNESIETLRRRRDSAELQPEQIGEAGVAEQAETREQLRTLLADLDQLPERQRAALVMRELSGLDFDQIGTAFGTSAAVARQTVYEARLGLRQLEEGREMRCTDVMRTLSDADGRVTRRRAIRAHLRNCPDCRAFGEEIAGRRENLAAIAPLPLAVSAGLLHSVLGAKAAGGGGALTGGVGGSLGASAGKLAGTSLIAKSVATAAVVAVVGVSAANRADLIHLPLGGGTQHRAAQDRTAHGVSAPRRAGANAVEGVRRAATDRRDREDGTSRRGSIRDLGDRRHPNHNPSPGSRSEGGQSPPGGGFGRSASELHGPSEGTPPAAERGQRTASSHKPSQAQASPPKGGGAPPPGGSTPRREPPVTPAPPVTSPARPPARVAPERPSPPPAPPSAEESSDSGATRPSVRSVSPSRQTSD
jgi:RNA polymerase sigma factor (sigma-70 family)